VTLNYIQGVVPTPTGFGRVTDAIFEPHAVRFIDENGAEARATVDHDFLRGRANPSRESA
jgi:hypothetical protein